MRFVCYPTLTFFAVLITGCATPPQKVFPPPTDYVPIERVQIASRFDTVEVTAATLGLEVNKCVPQLNGDSPSIQKHLKAFPNRNIMGFGHMSSANNFVLRQTTAVCLQKSSEKHPIFAAEVFLNTANPKGVPPDVVDDWYKQIALGIATKGVAKVAYVFANGNANTVSYWVETPHDIDLYYSSTFKKAGTWEKEKYDAQFSHPSMTGFSETKGRKAYLLAHRAL